MLHEKAIHGFVCDIIEKAGKKNIEIIIVDGDPEGSTINQLSDPFIQKIISSKGRALQQNQGAKHAKGEVLLFLHADTILPHDFYRLIMDAIGAGFFCGAFDLYINSSHPLIQIISKVASFRSRLTGIPYGDQAIFLKKELFCRIHGYPEIPIMEDIALMQKIKKSRAPFKILPRTVSTSARRWIKQGIVYTMIRNPLLALLYYSGVSPKFLVKFY